MTKQEAEILATRLKPIPFDDRFSPEDPADEVTPEVAQALLVRLSQVWLPSDSRSEDIKCRHNSHNLYLKAPLNSAIDFDFTRISAQDCHIYFNSARKTFLLFSKVGRFIEFGFPKQFRLDTPQELTVHLRGLADEWMPFFRRGCWLSGCDIKATAHEKAEWMQGLTRQEIEAWNLKF